MSKLIETELSESINQLMEGDYYIRRAKKLSTTEGKLEEAVNTVIENQLAAAVAEAMNQAKPFTPEKEEEPSLLNKIKDEAIDILASKKAIEEELESLCDQVNEALESKLAEAVNELESSITLEQIIADNRLDALSEAVDNLLENEKREVGSHWMTSSGHWYWKVHEGPGGIQPFNPYAVEKDYGLMQKMGISPEKMGAIIRQANAHPAKELQTDLKNRVVDAESVKRVLAGEEPEFRMVARNTDVAVPAYRMTKAGTAHKQDVTKAAARGITPEISIEDPKLGAGWQSGSSNAPGAEVAGNRSGREHRAMLADLKRPDGTYHAEAIPQLVERTGQAANREFIGLSHDEQTVITKRAEAVTAEIDRRKAEAEQLDATQQKFFPDIMSYVTNVLKFTYAKGHKWSTELQKQRGLPPEQANKIANGLALADYAIGSGIIAKVAYNKFSGKEVSGLGKIGLHPAAFVPWATVAYMATAPFHVAYSQPGSLVTKIKSGILSPWWVAKAAFNTVVDTAHQFGIGAVTAPVQVAYRTKQAVDVAQNRAPEPLPKFLPKKFTLPTGAPGEPGEARAPGRPQIYTSDQERHEAAKRQKREWARRKRAERRRAAAAQESVAPDSLVVGLMNLLEDVPTTPEVVSNLKKTDIDTVAEAMDAHDNDDWYMVLLLSAYGVTGDMDDAADLADDVYDKLPSPPDQPRQDAPVVKDGRVGDAEAAESRLAEAIDQILEGDFYVPPGWHEGAIDDVRRYDKSGAYLSALQRQPTFEAAKKHLAAHPEFGTMGDLDLRDIAKLHVLHDHALEHNHKLAADWYRSAIEWNHDLDEAVEEQLAEAISILEAQEDYRFEHTPVQREPGSRNLISHEVQAFHKDEPVGHLRIMGEVEPVHFDALYVHPDHRKFGVADKLMQMGIDKFGHKEITLAAMPYQDKHLNQAKLQRFYGRYGFKEAAPNSALMVRAPKKLHESVEDRLAEAVAQIPEDGSIGYHIFQKGSDEVIDVPSLDEVEKLLGKPLEQHGYKTFDPDDSAQLAALHKHALEHGNTKAAEFFKSRLDKVKEAVEDDPTQQKEDKPEEAKEEPQPKTEQEPVKQEDDKEDERVSALAEMIGEIEEGEFIVNPKMRNDVTVVLHRGAANPYVLNHVVQPRYTETSMSNRKKEAQTVISRKHDTKESLVDSESLTKIMESKITEQMAKIEASIAEKLNKAAVPPARGMRRKYERDENGLICGFVDVPI